MGSDMQENEYNQEPVFFCKKCLSLKIRDVEYLEDSEYCDECGSTEVAQASIEEWDKLYSARYGHHYIDN